MKKRFFSIRETENEYLLSIPFDQKDRAKSIPSYRWDTDQKCWCYPRTARVYDAIIAEFGDDLVSLEKINRPITRFVKDTEESLRTEIDKLKKELSEKDDLLKILRKEKDVSKASVESENHILKKTLSSYETQLDNLKHENISLKSQLTAISKGSSNLDHKDSADPYEIKRQLKLMARKTIENDLTFYAFIDNLNLDKSSPIEVAKYLESTLRKLLSTKDKQLSLHDLIMQARDADFLTEDGFQLAHLIRRHRNIMAHENVDIRTQPVRILLVFLSAVLLWSTLHNKR